MDVAATPMPAPAPAPLATAAPPPQPSVVLVTESDGTTFRRALSNLALHVRHVRSMRDGLRELDASTTAIIVDAPLSSRSAEEALGMLAAAHDARALPVFIAVQGTFSDVRAQELYDDGATAVVAWPDEVLLLPRLISELSDVCLADHEAVSVDEALTEATHARLAVDPDLASVKCSVRDGVAFISGSLDSLWKVRRLRQRISSVPGIVEIDLGALELNVPRIEDGILGSVLRTTLSGTADIDDETVSVSVQDGVATLAGVVASKRRLRRLLAEAEAVRGVRKIENHVIISPEAVATGQSRADTLQALVSGAFPAADVVVKSFGPIAVLSGSVATLAERADIEEAVEDAAFVQRVVNKISVFRS